MKRKELPIRRITNWVLQQSVADELIAWNENPRNLGDG